MVSAVIFVLSTLCGLRVSAAFVVSTGCNFGAPPSSTTFLPMIGGRGWDNQDYLSSLSGDDDDRAKSREEYEDFSERRKAFNARQEELMKSPQAKEFMKRRQEQQYQNLQQNEHEQMFPSDEFLMDDIPEGSGGGTRMGEMMARAKRMGGQRSQSNLIGGFHQQLLGPLDDEDDGDEEP